MLTEYLKEFGMYSEFDENILNTLELIGQGLDRNVYALDSNYCLKFPKDVCSDGVLQCNMEVKLFNQIEKRYKKYLCPIAFDGNGYTITNRAVPLHGENIRDTIYTVTNSRTIKSLINYLVKEFNMWRVDLEKITSWGVLNGKYVLIDYGRSIDQFDTVYE